MSKISKTIAAGILGLALAMTSLTPVFSAPIAAAPLAGPPDSDVTQVDWRGHDDGRMWHGHRGYRDHRPGYRRNSDGFWYPLAAFGAAAIVGGAIANSENHRSGRLDRQATWCADHHSTYRVSDDTYVTSAGMRATCVAPY